MRRYTVIVAVCCVIASIAFMWLLPRHLLPALCCLALAVGCIDGWVVQRLRWIRAWLVPLASALLPVAVVVTYEAFTVPGAFSPGSTLTLGTLLLGTFALAFIPIVLIASALVRAVRYAAP